MPPNLPDDHGLTLKKRARRRLVGAIALMVLMVIILPRILQDRTALAPQETIKITMTEVNLNQKNEASNEKSAPKNSASQAITAPVNEAVIDEKPITHPVNRAEPTVVVDQAKKTLEVQAVVAKPAVAQEKKPEIKAIVKTVEIEKTVENEKPQKNNDSFTIQVGVFSELSNVRQLQEKLKEAGLSSRTEKISTQMGEKIRLKAGNFASRQEAAYSLIKLQALGLTGMVIRND